MRLRGHDSSPFLFPFLSMPSLFPVLCHFTRTSFASSLPSLVYYLLASPLPNVYLSSLPFHVALICLSLIYILFLSSSNVLQIVVFNVFYSLCMRPHDRVLRVHALGPHSVWWA